MLSRCRRRRVASGKRVRVWADGLLSQGSAGGIVARGGGRNPGELFRPGRGGPLEAGRDQQAPNPTLGKIAEGEMLDASGEEQDMHVLFSDMIGTGRAIAIACHGEVIRGTVCDLRGVPDVRAVMRRTNTG